MPDDGISRTSSITSLIRKENFQNRICDFLSFLKDLGFSQGIWGGFSAAWRQSSVSISAIRQLRINQLTNRQCELAEGRKYTQRPCSQTTVEPGLCTWDNFTRGFSSVGAQEKKIGILELCYWLCQKITVRCQEKNFNPKSCVSYRFFAVFFFRETVTVMY